MSILIPQELLEAIPDLYETEESPDPICHVKLFLPHTNWMWYIMEISKKDHDICFGYVRGQESELGYFSLKEIGFLKGSLGLNIEMDISFQATSLEKIKNLVS